MLLAGVLVSTVVFAGRRAEAPRGASGMAVVKSATASYKLIYKAELASDIKVEILDANNELVFSETIKHSNGFARPYNFASLAEGEYTIRIDNGSNWLSEKVNYQSGRVEKLANLISLKDGRYLLTVPGQGEDALTVRIYNDEGDTLYSSTDQVTGDFGKIYNLSHVNGPFSFEVVGSSGASKILSR